MMIDVANQILTLLDDGHKLALEAAAEPNVQRFAQLARRAIGYFDAATTLLTAYPEMHDELIGHSKFVAARTFSRRYR